MKKQQGNTILTAKFTRYQEKQKRCFQYNMIVSWMNVNTKTLKTMSLTHNLTFKNIKELSKSHYQLYMSW